MSESFGIDIPVQISIIVWGIIMFVTSIIGFAGLKYLNIVAVPLMITVCVYGIYLGLSSHSLSALSNFIPDGNMTFIGAINVVIGGYIVGAVTVADFTRYQKSRADVVKSSVIGIFPAGVALKWAGAVLAIVVGTADLTLIFVSLGIPAFGLITLILSTWPANSSNTYSAGIDTVKMFGLKDSKRPLVTAICGVIGTVAGSFQIIFYFETILTWFGIIMAPIIGVMVADYWIIGKGKPENWHPTKGFNWTGIGSLAVGVLVSALVPYGIPSITGSVVSFVVYLVLRKVLPAPQILDTKFEKYIKEEV
jgi:cytosine permease